MPRPALVLAAVLLAAAAPAAAQTTPAPDSTGAAPAAAPIQAAPPDFPRGKISGYMFGDLYYNLAGNPAHVYDASGADLGQAYIDTKKNITKDLNGAQLRRAYFQLDNDLTARFATRFRLEADSKSLTSDGKIGVAVKAAYLQAKSFLPRADFYFGILSTPTFENAEEFWQYRSIEKTIADFHGMPSADVGAEVKGYMDPDHHVGYSAMIGDGNGQKPETDRFKKLYLSLPVRFGDLRIEPYVDYQSVRVNTDKVKPVQADSAAVNYDQATYKVFAGYELRRGAVGVEVLDRVNHQGPLPNQEWRGLSVFARGVATPALAAFARFDYWVADQRNPNRVDSQLWIAGLDWRPIADIHIMPNIEAAHFLAHGRGVVPGHNDVQARVTFYYKFSKPQS